MSPKNEYDVVNFKRPKVVRTLSVTEGIFVLAKRVKKNSEEVPRNTSPIIGSCLELDSLDQSSIRVWLDSFDTILTDCDGVLWKGPNVIPGAPQAIQFLRRMGKKVFYCTNNNLKSRAEYLKKLTDYGFGGEITDVLCTSYLAARYLADLGFSENIDNKKVYVIGSSGITKELDIHGIQYIGGPGADLPPAGWNLGRPEVPEILGKSLDPDVKAVIVGFDKDISYMKITKAANYLRHEDAVLIGTNPDQKYPHPGKCILPSTACMLGAVGAGAQREPVIVGKPQPFMFQAVQKSHPTVRPCRTLMIGDRGNTDILFGKNCGLQTLMVGSGIHSLKNIRAWEMSHESEEQRMVADFYVDSLGDLLSLFCQ